MKLTFAIASRQLLIGQGGTVAVVKTLSMGLPTGVVTSAPPVWMDSAETLHVVGKEFQCEDFLAMQFPAQTLQLYVSRSCCVVNFIDRKFQIQTLFL